MTTGDIEKAWQRITKANVKQIKVRPSYDFGTKINVRRIKK